MSQCPQRDNLTSFANGQCTDLEADRIRKHLEECTDCQEQVGNQGPRREDAGDSPNELTVTSVSPTSALPTIDYDPSRPVRSENPEHTATSLGATQPANSELTIPERIGHVTVQGEIGRGGMGSVYRGWDEMLQRDVAVKFLPGAASGWEDHLQRFVGGARVEAALRHPNVVQVFQSGMTDDQVPYMIMDFIDGPSLQQIIIQNGPMPLEAAVKITHDMASAVDTLHQNRLIHRDIKPANIMVSKDARVFITDFGLAGIEIKTGQSSRRAGTPAYMSPEAMRGKASPQSDVYALGVTLFEMLAGERPFDVRTTEESTHDTARPIPMHMLPGDLDDDVREIIERCLNPQEMFRFKSAGNVMEAIGRALSLEEILQAGENQLRQIVTNLEKRTGTGQDRPTITTNQTSYFDAISEIAETKRTNAPATESATPISGMPSGRKLQEFKKNVRTACAKCLNCEYQLFHVKNGDHCTECGTLVDESIDPHRLIYSDKEWFHKIKWGVLSWYATALTLSIAIFLFLLNVVLAIGQQTESTVLGLLFKGAVYGTIGATCLLLPTGIWLLTSREPDSNEKATSVRLALRWLLPVWIFMAAAAYFQLWSDTRIANDSTGSQTVEGTSTTTDQTNPGNEQEQPSWQTAVVSAQFGFRLITSAMVILLMVHWSRLAKRIPFRSGAARFYVPVLVVALCIPPGIGVSTLFTAGVPAIMFVLLAQRAITFRKSFRKLVVERMEFERPV